jgi:hypothetical protein
MAGRPNSLAIGEQQMDPAESATILALPAVGLAEVESDAASEIKDDELSGAA